MLVKIEEFLGRTPLTLSAILVLVLALVFGLFTVLINRYTIISINNDVIPAILLDKLTGETYRFNYNYGDEPWTVIPRP